MVGRPSETSARLDGKTLVVTGAAGFLGRHFATYAAREGSRVIPLVRARRRDDPPNARTLAEAILDPSLLECDAVVHFAAVRHRYGTTAADYADANCGLVETLMRAAASRTRRFVHVSSVGVYGFPKDLPIRETHPYAPVTTYSESKVEAERLVRRLGAELDLPFTIVRPTITYGTGDRGGMLDKLVSMIRARRYAIVGDGRNALHHTHVDDFVRGLAHATVLPEALSEDFILCGPEKTTLAGLSREVARLVDRRLVPVPFPLVVARPAASVVERAYRRLLGPTREPPLTHEKLDVMCVSTSFSGEKAERLLGFTPRIGYREGLARTIAAGRDAVTENMYGPSAETRSTS